MNANRIDPALRQEFAALAKRKGLLPVSVTPHYQTLIAAEAAALGGTPGPLYKVAYPTQERLALQAPGEVPDFVHDHANMPAELPHTVIQKYPNRVLFLITEQCNGHCMYCFRQQVLLDQGQRQDLPTKIRGLIDYVRQRPAVEEVIFSGGDPLTVPLPDLEHAFAQIRAHTQVRHIRVHTRQLAYQPEVFTEDLCRVFRAYDVRLVFHIVHPYELDAPVLAALERIQSYRLRCYNQCPLLRGVNDHEQVLARLLLALDECRIRPLSFFIADPIVYGASFRIPLARIFAIMNALNWQTGSWLNAVRLVLDTPIGKVRREDLIAWDRAQGLITFEREGKRVIYPDFPKELDIPGEIANLLWKS